MAELMNSPPDALERDGEGGEDHIHGLLDPAVSLVLQGPFFGPLGGDIGNGQGITKLP
jgi:hypothetical protein